MRLLIIDANILIDMEAAALMETLFQLPMQFGMPDLLHMKKSSRAVWALKTWVCRSWSAAPCSMGSGWEGRDFRS